MTPTEPSRWRFLRDLLLVALGVAALVVPWLLAGVFFALWRWGP